MEKDIKEKKKSGRRKGKKVEFSHLGAPSPETF